MGKPKNPGDVDSREAEDAETLRLFVAKVNKLRRSSFARKMFTEQTGVTLSYKEGKMSTEVRGPDNESIEAMVLTLRLTMQDNDRVSLRNLAKLMDHRKGDDDAAERFLDARHELNEYLGQSTNPPINANGHDLRNEQILRGVIYGELAHLNEAKRKAMESLRSHPFMSAMIDNTFNGVVAQFMDTLFYMQLQAADLYKRLTGHALEIDWPEEDDDKHSA